MFCDPEPLHIYDLIWQFLKRYQHVLESVMLCRASSFNVNELLLKNVLSVLLSVQYLAQFLIFSGVILLHSYIYTKGSADEMAFYILVIKNRRVSLDRFSPEYNADWLGRSSLNFNITIPYECNRRLCNLKEATANRRTYSHWAKAIARAKLLSEHFDVFWLNVAVQVQKFFRFRIKFIFSECEMASREIHLLSQLPKCDSI